MKSFHKERNEMEEKWSEVLALEQLRNIAFQDWKLTMKAYVRKALRIGELFVVGLDNGIKYQVVSDPKSSFVFLETLDSPPTRPSWFSKPASRGRLYGKLLTGDLRIHHDSLEGEVNEHVDMQDQ